MTYQLLEGMWLAAGGSNANITVTGTNAGTYSTSQVAAAIASAESGTRPGAIEQGFDYQHTGWGVWQITDGESGPQMQVPCKDYQILDPWPNAEDAVAKFNADGQSFSPAWATYTNGAYKSFLQHTTPLPVVDPGQYDPIGSAPTGTHNASSPGSTCGPNMIRTVAFQAQSADNRLWTWKGVPNQVGFAAATPVGMATGTSPSMTSLGNGNVAVAFAAAGTSLLWTWTGAPTSGGSAMSTGDGISPGTSPSVTYLPNGQAAVAFAAAGGSNLLWVWTGTPGTVGAGHSTGLQMTPGTSPSIAMLPNGQVAIAFQSAGTNQLWTWVGSAATGAGSGLSTTLGTGLSASSPSITILPNGQGAVAFANNGGHLWTWGGAVATVGLGADAGHTVNAGSSPSIMALSNGQAAVAFQPVSPFNLWTWVGTAGQTGASSSTGLGMSPGSSPSIVKEPPGANGPGALVTVAFQNNGNTLWTWIGAPNSVGAGGPANVGMNAGTSAGMGTG